MDSLTAYKLDPPHGGAQCALVTITGKIDDVFVVEHVQHLSPSEAEATKTSLHRVRRWEMRWVRKLLRLRCRSGEGRMQFIRTSNQLKGWFRCTGIKFLHQRILQAIHKSAWREGEAGAGLGDKLLLELRAQRCRMAWDAVKWAPVKLRRAENLAHGRPGNVSEWEDVLVQHYGSRLAKSTRPMHKPH